ncbi:MAG: hypothetical protein ABGZ17_06770 [Planctomycetaceae bacterium]
MQATRLAGLRLMLCMATLISLVPSAAWAQSSKPKGQSKSKQSKSGGASVRAIDLKADRLQAEFIRNAAQIAKDYSDAGQLEKSKQILQTLLKLNPGLTQVRDRVKLLDETILQANSKQFEIDAGHSWSPPVAQVFKGRAFRIKATGTYKFVTNLSISVQGFPEGQTGLAQGIPCGALMGMIIGQGKPGKPFAVQAGREMTPKDGGLLVLRINAPPGSQCSGKLQIQLSGYAKTKP